MKNPYYLHKKYYEDFQMMLNDTTLIKQDGEKLGIGENHDTFDQNLMEEDDREDVVNY